MHVILISYDAFSEDNWDEAKGLPNLKRLIQGGVSGNQLHSVYPTLTYPVHTTMVTGVYTDKHGIYHNNPLQPFTPEKDQEWFWYRKDIRVPTIYDAVKKEGMRTAGILWPVSGKASLTDYLPEIVAIRGENQVLKILKNGNPFYCLDLMLRYGKHLRGVAQPYLDDFTTLCAVDTIRRKKPHLLLLHLIDLDDAKHRHGTDHPEIKAAIRRMDQRLGLLMKAAEEAGTVEQTVFIIVGDHGQLDVKYKVRLNRLLQEQGLISEENGSLRWRAYLQSTGGAAYLHLKEGDQAAEEIAITLLKNAMQEEGVGIERLLSRKELDRLHIDPRIQYMVEAKEGYSFEDLLEEPIRIDLAEQGIPYATHGYLPDKANYRCNFVAAGPTLKKGYSLASFDMVDIAPTIGRILGVDFTKGDGRVLEEIFE